MQMIVTILHSYWCVFMMRQVASRRVVQVAGILLVLLGCLAKVGALFVSIPDPVAGGMFLALLAFRVTIHIIIYNY